MGGDDRLLVLAGAAAGVLLALVVTLVQPSTYHADASIVLVRQGQPPGSDPALAQSAEAASELIHSRAIAESAIANRRLDEPPDELLDRVSVDTEPESSLVRIGVDGPSREEARKTAQELVEVSSIRFNDQFGPGTVAQIWEAARAEEDRVSPRPARNLALGLLVGALTGTGLLQFRRRRPERLPRPPHVPRPAKARKPAPELVPAPIQTPAPEPEPAPAPAPAPAPIPVRRGPFVPPRLGEWHLADVEQLLDEHGGAFPDRIEELRWYLDSFRDVAEPDGRLPGGVEAVMEDVFRPLIERAR